jgi:hypothetical protein
MLVTRIVPSAEAQPSLPQLAPRIINLLAMSGTISGRWRSMAIYAP